MDNLQMQVPGGGTGGAGSVNFSAGTTSGNLDSVVFSNSNGVSFGLNGSTITASVNAAGGGLTNINVSAGTTSNNLSAITFSNANGISFGLNASTITGSHNALTSQSNQALSGSNGSFTFQTATFGNLNGASFYTSNGSLVASYTVPTQTNQTIGAYATGNTTQSSSGTIDARSLTFQATGAISAGVSNGSVVLSVPPSSNLTVSGFLSLSTNGSTMTIGAGPLSFYATSNTTQSSSGTIDGRSITFQGAGGASIGISNGSIVISGATGGAGGGGIGAGVSTMGNTAGSTGTVTTGNVILVGSGPISLSQSTGAAGSNATITINAPATSSLSATGIVSISTNVSTISIGAPAYSGGISTNGNTSGDTGFASQRLMLIGGNNITLSGSTNGGSMSLTISGANAGGAQTGISGIIVSDTTYTSGTVSFSNANGITFGSSAGQAITASHNALTSQSNQALSGSNGSFTFQTATFGNLNGISFYTSNGSLVASHTVPSVPVVSNALQSVGSATGSGTNTSRFAADDHVHAGVFSMGVSTAGNTVGDTRVDVGRFVLQGGNNITLSQITAANALNTIVLSGAAAGGAQTGISGVGVSDTTYTSGTVIFSNQANVTLGSSVNGASQYVRVSVAAQSVQSAIEGFGVSNTGATAGNTGISTGVDWVLAGSNLITLSQSTAAGVNTVWIQHPAWLTTAALSDHSHGASASNGSFGFQTLNFSNANNVTFGTSAGGIITASVVPGGGAVVSNAIQSVGSATGSGTNTSRFAADDHVHAGVFSMGVSTGGNTAGDTRVDVGRFVLAGGANITLSQATAANALNTISIVGAAGGGGVAVSAAGNSVSNGTVVFSNSNNVSFGMAGSTVTATITVPAQTNQTIGGYFVGNTTGQSSSSTVDARSVSIDGAGIVSAGWSAGSIRISATQSNQAFSADASSTFQTLTFQNSNGISFSNNAGAIRLTHDLAGTSTGFAGANISGSMTHNSAGLNLSLSVAAPGAAAENNWHHALGANTAGNTTASGSTIGLSGINLTISGTNASVMNLSVPATSSLVGTSGLSVSTNGSTISVQPIPVSNWQRYGDAITAAGSNMSSNSCTIVPFMIDWPVSAGSLGLAASVSAATAANTSSAGYAIGASMVIYTKNGATLSSLNSGSMSVTTFHQSNSTTAIANARLITMGLATASVFTPGQYWAAVHVSTTTSGQTSLAHGLSMGVIPTWATGFGAINHVTGGNTTNTRGLNPGLAVIATAATRATLAFSNITGHSGNPASLANVWLELRSNTVW